MNMKKITLLLLISISLNSFAQDVFTMAFGGELPTAIQVVDNDLYVATFQTNRLYRLAIDNPTNIEMVAEFTNPLWKMDFDPLTNDFYCNNLGSLSSVDLDQSIPVTPVTITSVADGNGLEVTNNMVYVSDGQNVYSYDIAVGISSYQLFYTDSTGIIRNPSVYNNELYYQLMIPNNSSPNNGIYKIDTANPSAQKVLVASNPGGFLQSSLIINDYLYLGLETSNMLVRLDLSTTNLPITPVVMLDNLGAGVIGLAHKGSTIYYTTGQQIIYTYQDAVLSTDDVVQNPISMYPNPTKELIHIKGNLSGNPLYSIYTQTGVKIKEDQLRNTINISELASGIYFLMLNQNSNIQTVKIIKTDR